MDSQDINAIPLLDNAIISEAKMLLCDKFAKLAGYFIEDSAMYATQIQQALEHADWETLVPPAHTLKSSARQMGAPRLGLLAEQIERTAREQIQQYSSKGELAALIAPLSDLVRLTQTAYHAII